MGRRYRVVAIAITCCMVGAACDPALAPALAQDVPLPIQKEPAPPRVTRTQTTVESNVNGNRTKTIQLDSEKIVINDRHGEDIRIEHTQTVDGKQVTKTVEAADLPALEKKDPVAAQLYRKYGARQAAPVRVIQGGGILFTTGAPAPRPSYRKIRGVAGTHQVEINEQEGDPIQVIIKPRSGRTGETMEISADTLAELRKKSPQAAQLYEQLVGQN